MITSVVKKVFGSRNERVVRRLGKVVKHINELEPGFEQLSDAELKDKTAQSLALYCKNKKEDTDINVCLNNVIRVFFSPGRHLRRVV